MTDGKRSSFPRVSERAWFQLREKFKQSIPSKVTPTYVTALLPSMTTKSAADNVIRPLRSLGLLDKDGKPTELST